MDKSKLYTVIKQVTNSLTPSNLEVLSVEDEVITIRVVSDSFSNIPMVRRFKNLADLFEKEAPKFVETYTLIFEAWTRAESIALPASSSSSSKASSSSRQGRAAKDANI